MKSSLIIVFGKNIVKGKVKTRLAKTIGDSKALQVYKILLMNTAKTLKSSKHDIAMFYSDFKPTNKTWSFAKYQRLQKGDLLGERLENAFKWGFKKGYKKICVIGTDLWNIDLKLINDAFKALKNCNVVFGPSSDGGYYLLGLKKMILPLFKIKSWGTKKVLEDSVKKISDNSIFYLAMMNDIDNEKDLKNHPDLISLI